MRRTHMTSNDRPTIEAGDKLRAEATGYVYEVQKVTDTKVHVPELSPVSREAIEDDIAADRITHMPADRPSSIEEYVAEHHGPAYDDPAAVLVIPSEEDVPHVRGLLETAYHRIEPEYRAAPADSDDPHHERVLQEGSLYQELLAQLSGQERDADASPPPWERDEDGGDGDGSDRQ